MWYDINNCRGEEFGDLFTLSWWNGKYLSRCVIGADAWEWGGSGRGEGPDTSAISRRISRGFRPRLGFPLPPFDKLGTIWGSAPATPAPSPGGFRPIFPSFSVSLIPLGFLLRPWPFSSHSLRHFHYSTARGGWCPFVLHLFPINFKCKRLFDFPLGYYYFILQFALFPADQWWNVAATSRKMAVDPPASPSHFVVLEQPLKPSICLLIRNHLGHFRIWISWAFFSSLLYLISFCCCLGVGIPPPPPPPPPPHWLDNCFIFWL